MTASIEDLYERLFTKEILCLRESLAGNTKRLEEALVTHIKRLEDLRTADELRYAQLRDKEQTALQAALLAAEKAVQTALLTSKEAVVKAETATEKRLEGLNELRQGVATKDQLDALDRRIGEMKETMGGIGSMQTAQAASLSGRAGGLKDNMSLILFLITVAGFVLLWIRK